MATRLQTLALAGAFSLVACSSGSGASNPDDAGGAANYGGGPSGGFFGGATGGGGATSFGGTGQNAGGGFVAMSGGSLGVGGGVPPSGGTDGAGGSVDSGGSMGSGGSLDTGGSIGSGGAPGNGGSVASGGALGNGGVEGAGGAQGACPGAPATATAGQQSALQIVNDLRIAAGAGCATMVEAANTSSTLHCQYYAENTGTCIANAHAEVSGCTGFVAASFGARMTDAGYTGQPAFEVMAFANDPTRAIAGWVNSVWHRLPILDPWITDFGYGAATKCDTMDFGNGTPAPSTTVVTYPYMGQTGLPASFDGSHEGPVPPAPASGWPSGSPITVYAKKIAVTSHVISVQSTGAPLAHTFLTSADSSFLKDDIILYTDAPFSAATTYRVQITGTDQAGALNLDWTFTTK